MAKKSVAYLRVSTDGQDTKSQRDKIQEFAKENDYEVENWFVDEALSGTLDDRPELLKLKEWVPQNAGKSVLMVGIDRLARDFTIYADFSSLFANNNVHAEYLNCPTIGEPSIDTLLQNIIASFAAYEKDVIRDRMQRGKNYKLKNGIIAAGGPALFGYKFRTEYYPNGKKDKFYEIDEENAETVRLFFRMLLSEEWKVQGIGRELTRLNVKTSSGTTRWAPTSVRSLLANSTYMGEYRYGKTKMMGIGRKRHEVPRAKEEQLIVHVPPIITKEEFEKAQEILKRLAQGLGGRERKKNDFLLSGLIKCGKCKYLYSGGGHKTGKNIHSYYRCNSINRYDDKGEHHSCGNATLKTFEADTAVWNALAKILMNPEVIDNKIDEKKHYNDGLAKIEDYFAFNARLNKLRGEEDKLIECFAKNIFSEEKVRKYQKELDDKIAKTEKEKQELAIQIALHSVEHAKVMMGPAPTKEEVLAYTHEKKRDLVKKYILEISVLPTNPTQLEIVFSLPVEPNKTIVTINNSPPFPEQ